jgi:porphobilinogen synthase
MPGIFQLPVHRLAKEAREIRRLGISGIILFGVPEKKDPEGTGAADPDGVVPRALREIKNAAPELTVIADVCLCEYTDHGHCGIIHLGPGATVNNDATLEVLARSAAVYARAGADWVAPSGMMDGAVGALRRALDEEGFSHTAILAYAVKYAGAFYGPFREAAGSAPRFGDRLSYQMDPANAREALREAELDWAEGADVLMVKPALAYLDVLYRLRERFNAPLAAYNVSGEYSMVKAAATKGWVDEKAMVLEILTSIRRAGADMILTYHAKDAARWL